MPVRDEPDERRWLGRTGASRHDEPLPESDSGVVRHETGNPPPRPAQRRDPPERGQNLSRPVSHDDLSRFCELERRLGAGSQIIETYARGHRRRLKGLNPLFLARAGNAFLSEGPRTVDKRLQDTRRDPE